MSSFSMDNDIEDWDERPINPVNLHSSGSSTASSADLKSQLSQLQQKLNLNNIRPVRAAPNTEPEIHLPPTFSQGNVLSTTSNNNTSAAITVANNTDKSVDFLGDLSDGLLIESRKLSYENKQFKRKLLLLTTENDSMKKQISNLNLLNNQLSEKEEESNDKIWNLETEINNFKKITEKNKSDLFKVQTENKQSITLIDELKSSVDVLQNEKTQLSEYTTLSITKLNNQLNELKEANENLNDENDILHKNIVNLKEDLSNLKSEDNNVVKAAETSFAEFDDSIIQDPIPLDLSDNDISKLDHETLQKNLKLSYRQLLKLKNQNSKIKSDLLKLKHKSPTKKQLLPNDINDENDMENSWGNFVDDSFVKSESGNNASNIILSDDEIDNENSFFDGADRSSPSSTRKSSISKSKQSYMLIVPKTTLDTLDSDIDLKKIDLTEFQTISLSNSIANQLFLSSTSSKDKKNKCTTDEMLQLVSEKEFNTLSNPSIDYIKSKSESHNHVYIPIDEHQKLISTATESTSKILELEKLYKEQTDSLFTIEKQLDQTTSDLKSKNIDYESLKAEHDNPSLDFMKNKLSNHNYIMLDATSHKNIQKRIEGLQDKIQDSNKNLASLRKTIDQLKNEKTGLEEKIRSPDLEYMKDKSTLLHYVFIPETEHIQLETKLTVIEAKLKEKENEVYSITNAKSEIESKIGELESIIVDLKGSCLDYQSKLKSLEDLHESPDAEYIKNKSTSHGLVAVTVDEHEQLKKENSDYSDKVVQLSSEIDANKSENSKLLALVDEKESKLNSLKVEFDALMDDLVDLKNNSENPDAEYIRSKASLHDLTAIPMKEHESLKEQLILKDAKLIDYSRLQDEFNAKHDEVTKLVASKDELNKSIEEATTNLKSRESELEALKKQLESPSVEYVMEKSQSHGFVTITKEEHDKLQAELSLNFEALTKKERELTSLHKIKADLERQAEIEGSKSVSLELHESVQSDLNETKQQLDDHKKQVESLKQVEIELSKKESELSTLVAKASELETKAAKLDETTFELEKLKDAQIELDKKHEELEGLKLKQSEMQDHITSLKGKENELFKTLQELDSKNTELKSLKSSYEQPDIDYIHEKSKSLGYVSITLEEHSISQSNLAELEKGQKKNIELEDKVVMLSTKNTELADLNASLENSVAELTELKKMLESPNTQYIKEKSGALGLVTLPVADHEGLQNNIQSLSTDLETLKSKIAVVENEKVELNEKIKSLETASTSPSIDYIQSKSASLGVIPISIAEHTSMKSELQRKDILLKENKQQLEELESLKKEFASKKTELDDTLVQLDTVTASYESPSLYYLKDKLLTLNYVAVTESDYNELEQSKTDLIQKAGELSGLLKSTETALEEKNKELEQVSTELESTKKSYEAEVAKRPEEIDETRLRDLAASKGMTLLTIADISKGFEMGKSSSIATVTSANVNDLSQQPIENIIEYLEPKGYIVMTNEEYTNVFKGASANDDELDNLADISHDLSDLESDIESKKHMLEELDTRSRHNSIISSSSSIGSVSISVENVLSQKYHKLNDKVLDLSKEIDELNQEKLKITKQINRLSVSPEAYSNNTLTKKLNKKIANIDSKIEVKSIELKSQQSALTAVQAYLEKAKGLDLAPVTSIVTGSSGTLERSDLEREISELQSMYDKKKQEMDKLAKDIGNSAEPGQLVERLSLLGYSVVSPSGDNSMIKEISLKGNKVLLTSIVNTDSFNKQSGNLTLDDFAEGHGYSIIPTTDINNNRGLLDLGELSLTDLEARATELGYTVVSNQKMNLIIAKSNEPKLPESFTLEELEGYAKKLDLRVISNEDIGRLKARTITSRELASKAEELNLVLLSPDEVKDLKTHEPVTIDNIAEKGKEFDIMCIPHAQFVATTVSRTPDIPNVTVLPNSYYKILSKSHEWYKKNKDKLGASSSPAPTPAPKPQPATIPEDDDSFDLSAIMQSSTSGNHHLPANFDAISLHTVDTVISNRKVIIAAVAQTIMGEYLFKYYRKLGPFSSVSDTRHERYFWIHPYSMTIYWSPLNPVASDPAKNQIKALSILDVKVVEDNNPLPVGIYHKSIIIKSHDKNIKITCPTRQLHNVWYNSLKFLLDRSADTWVNDDELEDQYQQDFTLDNKTKLERTQSQKLRRVSASPSLTSRVESRIASKSTSMRTLRR